VGSSCLSQARAPTNVAPDGINANERQQWHPMEELHQSQKCGKIHENVRASSCDPEAGGPRTGMPMEEDRGKGTQVC
jgi:hypothetical protein